MDDKQKFHPWDEDIFKKHPAFDQKCLNAEFDKNNPDQIGKPRLLHCPCPRCSPYCMIC